MGVPGSADTASHEAPLLLTVEDDHHLRNIETANAVDDQNGRKMTKRRSRIIGGWRSAWFIMGVGMAERFAFYGVSSNLITYLTGPMGQSTATASVNIDAWAGFTSMLPLVGAFVADSYLGRYRTILFSSLLYVLGLGLLTISVSTNSSTSPASPFQILLFFSCLYLIAIAQGGHKPCIEAFGAEQFDSQDPEDCKGKSSFFNWWACVLAIGSGVSYLTLFYIQENLSWGLGFGIPCIFMIFALIIFLFGTKTYRYCNDDHEKSSFMKIVQVFIKAARNWRAPAPPLSLTTSGQFKFFDKAVCSSTVVPDLQEYGSFLTLQDYRAVCTLNDVNEAKGVLRLIPIWCTCLSFAIVYAQSTTLFTKQGSTMDRAIGSNFKIPAASLQIFTTLSVILFIPIYDRAFVPIARFFTGIPSGITALQRIGLGMFTCTIAMVVAALVEKKRLEVALAYGLVDNKEAIIPMSIWWLVPQYLLFGLSDIFTPIGLQELFFDQVPKGLRSVGIGLIFSIFGVGSFISSFLISTIEKTTSANGQDGWFSNNLNKAHLDYFYWVLVGLCVAGMVPYICYAKSFIYSKWN